MIKHLTIKLYGRVQNVGFRASTQNEANRLGVKGTVTNLSDGSVLIEAEAHEEAMYEFLDWCQNGPQHAAVEKIETSLESIQNYQKFRVI